MVVLLDTIVKVQSIGLYAEQGGLVARTFVCGS